MKKKILFLMHSLRFGGAERQTADLIASLDPTRFSTGICCFSEDDGQGITVSAPSLIGIFRLGKKGRFDVALLHRLAAVLAKTLPDIVVCVNQYPLPFVHTIRAATGGRYAIVPVMHSTTFRNRYTDILIKWIFGPLANSSESIIFVCATQRDHWVDRYRTDPGKAIVIHNGIDVARYRPRFSPAERVNFKKTLGFESETYVVCLCAAFRPEKRQADLVSAAKVLRDSGADIRVILVGDGVERSRIEQHISSIGMRDFVHLPGYQSDVRPYLESADVVVNCSQTEAFSLAILEAMSMGKAMVCTDVGGTREQIREGENGFLYEAGDIDTLANRIAMLFDSGRRDRFGAASRKIMESEFSAQAMVVKYQRLYDSMP